MSGTGSAQGRDSLGDWFTSWAPSGRWSPTSRALESATNPYPARTSRPLERAPTKLISCKSISCKNQSPSGEGSYKTHLLQEQIRALESATNPYPARTSRPLERAPAKLISCKSISCKNQSPSGEGSYKTHFLQIKTCNSPETTPSKFVDQSHMYLASTGLW